MPETMGSLKKAVNELKVEQRDQRGKLDQIGKQMYAAIAVITFIGAVIWYFANSINNIVIRQFAPPATQQQQQIPPATQQPAPSPK